MRYRQCVSRYEYLHEQVRAELQDEESKRQIVTELEALF